MKNLIKNIFALAVLGAVIFIFRTQIENAFTQLKYKYLPCREPIYYEISKFNKSFGLTREEFLKDIKEAETVWEAPSGKNLFEYKEGGDLKINLVYDDRQKATVKLQNLDTKLDINKANYEKLKSQYDQLQREYNELKSNNTDVYTLNRKAEEINALVVLLNKMVASLNLDVKNYNQIGEVYSGEFEEGLYEQSIEGTSIDIYQYENKTKLIRVIAHELGHALGLEHVKDSKSIMYELNIGTSKSATADDILELNRICNSSKI